MEKIQLYSLATPNGQKISIALEEMKLPYDAHLIDITKGEQFSKEFVTINPNSKIPVIVDPNGPDGDPIFIMESGAILIYLARKSGRFLPSNPRLESEVLQWLFFQTSGVGPMFGQFGHFYKYATANCDHPYPVSRYTNEVKRLLGVLDKRLEGREFLAGDYSIADIATFPWIDGLTEFYAANEYLQLDQFKNVNSWFQRCTDRPAAQKGKLVCRR